MKRLMVIAASATMLAGCSMTLPVQGVTESGDETFTGSATGYADGAGKLELRSNHGLVCTGTFVYVTERTGSGTFNCSNGQSGPFNFVSSGTRGTGTGRIGNKPFTFTFG